MEVAAPQLWADFATGTPATAARLLAHPEGGAKEPGPGFSLGDCCHGRLATCPAGRESRDSASSGQECGGVVLAIGPEGGFAAEEVALAQTAGWHLVDLGPRILRVETAAVVLVALASSGRS
jgi:16S rRNA (uracil1498-N3)-methyltransferase